MGLLKKTGSEHNEETIRGGSTFYTKCERAILKLEYTDLLDGIPSTEQSLNALSNISVFSQFK